VPPTPVRWLIRPNGSETRWDPAELKTHLQNTTGPQESRDRPQRAKPADLDKGAIKDLPVRVQAALGKSQLKDGSTDVDRSETVYAVVAACFDTGLTVEQAEQVVRTRTDLADRLDENPKDLDRIWSKLESKRDEEGRAPRGSVPPSAELPPPMTETPATGKAPSLPPTVDVTGLWGRPVMRQIQVWAQAKMVSPLAALGATLPRALAMLHPEYVLPDVVIGYGSLNFYTGLVGRSGGGKGGPNTIAERAIRFVSGKQDLPLEALDEWRDSRSNDELYTAELGSGEGFGHAYVRMDKKTKELHQVRTSVLYNCPEIDWLRGVGGRQGSTMRFSHQRFAPS
jgi:hypothetical protein